MTAHLFVASPQIQLPVRRSSFQSSRRNLEFKASLICPSECPTTVEAKPLEATTPLESIDSDALWTCLLESMPEGVIVVAQTLQPIYISSKAKRLCQQLSSEEGHIASLLDMGTEVCHRLLKAEL
ncbi:MAG: hypothetical protein LH660_21095, partial [Phormidesmis sp. CAN_BIN36]|nr:hypothetical protein [Phormidesmis sp. CAN_BIN36]